MFLFLGSLILILLVRLGTAIVYFLIKDDDMGPINTFEFTIILGITEIIPWVMILVSFVSFLRKEMHGERFLDSNIQDSKESFTNSLLFGKDDSTFIEQKTEEKEPVEETKLPELIKDVRQTEAEYIDDVGDEDRELGFNDKYWKTANLEQAQGFHSPHKIDSDHQMLGKTSKTHHFAKSGDIKPQFDDIIGTFEKRERDLKYGLSKVMDDNGIGSSSIDHKADFEPSGASDSSQSLF